MKKAEKDPTAPVTLTFDTVAETRDRIEAVAKSNGMDAAGIIAEALYVHLHKLESRGNAKLRRQSVCWGCGAKMDAKVGTIPPAEFQRAFKAVLRKYGPAFKDMADGDAKVGRR